MITYSASKCPHCGHAVTSSDIQARAGGDPFDSNVLLGCIAIPALIALAVYMVASAGPSAEERRVSDAKFAEEYELKEKNARFACSEWGLAKACDEVEGHAELARYYRQRAQGETK
jgi:hypothetical protein